MRTVLNSNHNYIEVNLKVANFINSNHSWNITLLHEYLPPYIISNIKGAPLPLFDIEDCTVWGPTTLGQFLVELATWLAHNIPDNTLS